MASGEQRIPGVDALRGLAVLGIVAIHAGFAPSGPLHGLVLDRAPYVFIVMIGLAAQLWYQRWAEGEGRGGVALAFGYLTATGRRLLVPYGAWLLVALLAGATTGRLPGTLAMWLLAPLAIVPWAGPTWLLTAVAWLSPLIPLVRLVMLRAGPALTALLALLSSWYCHTHWPTIVEAGEALLSLPPDKPAFYYYWAFSPAYLWHASAGMWLGRRRGQVTAVLWAVAALALVWGYWSLRQTWAGPFRAAAIRSILDVPLAVLALWLCHGLSRVPLLGAGLCALGRHAWGLYLGHLLVVDMDGVLDVGGQAGPAAHLVAFVILLATGLGLSVLAGVLRAQLGRRLPALSRG